MTGLEQASARPLPPGVDEAGFARALDAFAAALGSEKVLTGEDELREFRDPFASPPGTTTRPRPSCLPTTVEEVQEVVRIANRTGCRCGRIGTGRNNGYGGPAPRVKGSVIVSLRRMNRVLEIDEECAYAVVEPGVRWFDLYEAIQAGGHRLMLSIADLGWGSVIGNTLDHGVTYLPYGVDMAMQCGMEVVLPERRGDAHRHGRDAGQPVLARLQARPRPDARPAVHAVELRDRHQDGRLADALAGGLHAALAAGLAATRTSARWSTRCER